LGSNSKTTSRGDAGGLEGYDGVAGLDQAGAVGDDDDRASARGETADGYDDVGLGVVVETGGRLVE
jgi:hypothetical protein